MTTVASLDTRLAVTEKTVEHHEKQLNGNGKLGICDRVDDVETSVTNHLDYHKALTEAENKKQDFWNKVLLLGIGMILSNVGVIVFALWK